MKTLEELKAHAYDCIANRELWEKELRATNDLIAKMSKEQQEATKTSTEVVTTSETTGTNEPKE